MSFAGSASNGLENAKLDPLKCRDGSRPRILLAEDSPAARVLTGALLKRIGCKVDSAEHGEEAVNYVKNGNYDLILMDIEMPIMDGVVAAKEIRTMGGAAGRTPIVALSAFLADTQKSAFWEKHFDVALAKPAGKHQLHATIRQVLDLQEENPQELLETSFKENLNLQFVEEPKLTRILMNICDDDKITLLKTAGTELSKNSSELAICHHQSCQDGMLSALHNLCGLSSTFAAMILYELVVSFRNDITNDVATDIENRVRIICECAESTAQILNEKSTAFPKVVS